MALFSLTILPPTASSLTMRFYPPGTTRSHSLHRLPLLNKPLFMPCSRVSVSKNDLMPPDEDPWSTNDIPEDGTENPPLESGTANSPLESNPSEESLCTSSAADPHGASDPGGESPLNISTWTPPINNVAALQFDKERQREELQKTLATLAQSLALLSSSLNEVSSAVRVLSANLSAQLTSASPSSEARFSPSEMRDRRETIAREGRLLPIEPPEPWDTNVFFAADMQETSGAPVEGSYRSEEDTVPPYLVEQNTRAHKLAYKLQQAFIQARIEGLGKPFEVAVEDFAGVCMEAHAFGIGLKELQLQLVLQDGSLTGAFAIRNQKWSNDPILNDESRIRALWIRLVYSTLAQLEPTETDEQEEADPTDSFVKQVLQSAFKEGYDLERLKLEQSLSGPDVSSGAVKALRQNQHLILLTLEKAKHLKK